MARPLAALALALFLSVGGVADLVDVQGEGCENGAVCPATSGERAGRAAVLQDTPNGEDIGVELLQSNKGRKEIGDGAAPASAPPPVLDDNAGAEEIGDGAAAPTSGPSPVLDDNAGAEEIGDGAAPASAPSPVLDDNAGAEGISGAELANVANESEGISGAELANVVNESEGISGAELANVVNEAHERAQEVEVHPSVAALAAAVGTSVNGSLLAKAVSEALAKKGNVSMPSVQELKDSFRSRYQVRLANILSAAVEDSLLPDEAKELASKELRNTSSSMFVAFEATISKAEANGTLPDFANVTKLTMAGGIFDSFQDALQDQFEKKVKDIYNTAKRAAGGSAASTIKDTFGIDVNELPFDIPGITGTGSTSCASMDTGGTCGWGGCDSSRNAVCNKASNRCVCKSGDCAVGGKCGCSTDTGGTCFTGACSSWRGAICKSGSCVCASGQCASADGKCS